MSSQLKHKIPSVFLRHCAKPHHIPNFIVVIKFGLVPCCTYPLVYAGSDGFFCQAFFGESQYLRLSHA
ncbi:hypothetical protein T440DRAFT_463894 [Plenodomus tracheiphilus IPT5]|uniref:Uncharacterized protein n=1 Tax=Plenodomus tracheiphilus IPT5 TaxID=1408161 RepID=A0A6A7BJ52_9PLEO|nr:hypothetical protein T440DRAFT_463894 [Plenodomus tracheiphilus IPT5]